MPQSSCACANTDCQIASAVNDGDPSFPHEIHVTVADVERVADFQAVCVALGVRPLLIDNLNHRQHVVGSDLMTNAKMRGPLSAAVQDMLRIAEALRGAGFNVVREKIETVPWHSAAESMREGQYFEVHFPVTCAPAIADDIVTLAATWGLHCSRNRAHESEDQTALFLTLRTTSPGYKRLEERAREVAASFVLAGAEVGKTVIEFAVYDSNVAHDASWMERR